MKKLTQNGAGSITIDIPIDLKTKLLTPESTFMKSLSRMVVNRCWSQKSILYNPGFLAAWIKEACFTKTCYSSIINRFENFGYSVRESLFAAGFWSYNKSGTNGCLVHLR